MADGRESIWSVTEEERRWYFALFPAVLICSVSYYAGFVIDWTQGVHQSVGILMLAFGALGVSSAIFSMVLVAGGSFMVISMGWLRDKVNAQRESVQARLKWKPSGRSGSKKVWKRVSQKAGAWSAKSSASAKSRGTRRKTNSGLMRH